VTGDVKSADGYESLPDRDIWELDLFLARHSLPRSIDPVTWSRPGTAIVADKTHLAELLAELDPGEDGVVTASDGRWARVSKIARPGEDSLYTVDVHDGGSASRSGRVFRGWRSSDYPSSSELTLTPDPCELFPADTASNVIWGWLQVGLPVGFIRT
jgi:hypothetical protein